MLKNVVEVESRGIAASYNRNNNAAIFFFDFASAFPSLARHFIWIALAAIGLPHFVIKAIQALYLNNLHFVRTSSGLHYVFTAFSGVRQGCPLSSLIFVLVTDCINRALFSCTGKDDLLLAYADDIALVIQNLSMRGPTFAQLFVVIGEISSLYLNLKKCVCIPLWTYTTETVRRFLHESIPQWKDFAIQDFGKYLGFLIGPGANNQEWNPICQEILKIAAMIRKLGLPKFHAISLFRMLGMGKAQFTAQLRAPPSDFHLVEKAACRLIIGGPGNWVPVNLLSHLKSQCYFPCEISCFRSLCSAAMYRTAQKTILDWRQDLSVIEDARSEDASNLRHIHPEWEQLSAVHLFSVCVEKFSLEDVVRFADKDDINLSNITGRKDFEQFAYSMFLETNAKFSFVGALRYRFQRCGWFGEEDACMFAPIAVQFLKDISAYVPLFAIFCVINTFFNGWATSARFQSLEKGCLLCSECRGIDSLDHYACCLFAWKTFSSKFRINVSPCSMSRFLGLNAEDIDTKVLHACHMFAVKRAVDMRRREGTASTPAQVNALIWQGYKTASMYHKGLAKKLVEMWIS